ncbi:hypothetical protein ACPEH1_08950 [Stenotrophomonas sp. NPDC077421]|uniref:hypothetical protein n=1 Tax=Stenotrophomonas sp. NPDC077421 TaxID=3414699 RepID=UPI003C2BBF76
MSRAFLLFAPFLLSASTCSAAADTQTLQEHCTSTAADDLVVIGISAQGHEKVSACPPGVDSGCIYGLTVGQTYSAGTPDLNADGQPDQLVRHFGSNYGDIDVVHYLGFVQCGDGTAIKVLEGQFKDVIAPIIITEPWPDLTATRGCAAPGHEEDPPQEVKLSFNPETYRYEEAPKLDPASACTHSP